MRVLNLDLICIRLKIQSKHDEQFVDSMPVACFKVLDHFSAEKLAH